MAGVIMVFQVYSDYLPKVVQQGQSIVDRIMGASGISIISLSLIPQMKVVLTEIHKTQSVHNSYELWT